METRESGTYYSGIFWFKSYYVVWKRQTMYEYMGMPTRFKSYYVVWKHFLKKINVDEKESLNRTM